eukprot:TRINITY_DN24725_c0_g1_i1.p1 TRINITY_DN24725_c0_g1~~TRINITY_DN24725_c0_g1_i1.p1  ORF type:complete len:412 (-),score=76.25 TRINITY_DN24725_c0_g1_i1:287-1453(-)
MCRGIVSEEPCSAWEELQSALQVWEETQSQGYLLADVEVDSLLASAAWQVPGCDTAQNTELVMELFVCSGSEDRRPLFHKMLRARHGQVHFLHFWRAFGEAARMLGQQCGGVSHAKLRSDVSDVLAQELVLLRDTALRMLELHPDNEDKDYGSQVLPASDIHKALQKTAAMSLAPKFWSAMESNLLGGRWAFSLLGDVRLDDLTALLLTWLREADSWEPDDYQSGSTEVKQGTPVYLHVYDVSLEEEVHKINKVLAHKRNPLKFGGIFHAGVEVNGLEWAFGMSEDEAVPGISCTLPRAHPQHRYRQTLRLKDTKLSPEEVAELLSVFIEEYPGHDYDLLRRNCCHFANDFSKRLGAGRIPGWIHRLARVGAFLDSAVQRVSPGRSLL